METKSSLKQVLELLQDGMEHTPQEIGRKLHLQHNTVVKNFKFLRDRGYVINKRRVSTDNGFFFKYWME